SEMKYFPAHFLVVCEGKLDVDGRPVLVLAKKTWFTREEVKLVTDFIAQENKLTALYLPWGFDPPSDIPSAFGDLIGGGSAVAMSQQYPYNISPVHDNAPFFFFTFKTRRLFDQILHPHSDAQGIDWKVNLGVAVLFMLLAISFLAVLAFLI